MRSASRCSRQTRPRESPCSPARGAARASSRRRRRAPQRRASRSGWRRRGSRATTTPRRRRAPRPLLVSDPQLQRSRSRRPSRRAPAGNAGARRRRSRRSRSATALESCSEDRHGELPRLLDVTDATFAPPAGGRLIRLPAARGGTTPGEPTMVLQHREALIWTLGKAAALEQLVMCQYLYATFSLKDRDDEGLTPEQLEATRRWRRELFDIGAQEMLHLSLVQNLLTAIGAGSALE